MTGNIDLPLIHSRERVDVFGATRSYRKYSSLAEISQASDSTFKKLKICIVTQDFVGPIKNGGIGTAYTYAAKAFAQAGHDVTVLYSIKSCVEHTLDYWVKFYSGLNIKFIPVSEPSTDILKGPTSEGLKTPYYVYEWLKQRDDQFDFIHASEWRANVYLCLQAKQTGLYFQNTKFVIKCSSPTLWNKIGNAEPIADVKSLSLIYTERRCVEMADYVICGSQYLLNWMEDNGYAIPFSNTFVQPNIFPVAEVDRSNIAVDPVKVNELVFFGRLEPRKGLHFFVDALIQLKARGFFDKHDIPKISLLGKPRVGFDYKEQINKLEKALGISIDLLDEKNQPEALAYLNSRTGRVAVMPSLMDNSPFGVYECLSLGIPFITSNAGGGNELIATKMHSSVLFDPNPSALSNRISDILENGCIVPEPSFDFEKNIEDWMDWHLWANEQSVETVFNKTESHMPLVSVCMAHYNRGALLNNAIESLEKQVYENVEIIIVDDGSTDPEALKVLDQIENNTARRFPIKIIRQSNKYLGAVRNTGVREAKGEYILFMDDDNEAKPHEIDTFVKVALNTNAEILTCWSDSFSGERPSSNKSKFLRIAFQGENIAMALVRNPYGDSNCFVRRDAFEKIKGFTEHYKVGLDDSEFFTRAVLSGMKIMLIPEALYWYRINEVRMRHGQYNLYSGRVRMSEPMTQGLHPDLANIIRYAQGMGYVHGPWQKKVNKFNSSPTDVNAPLFVIELGRRLVSRFPFLYPIAKYLHQKLHQ